MYKAIKELPENYEIIKRINFDNDKLTYILINVISVILAIVVIVIPFTRGITRFCVSPKTFIFAALWTLALGAIYIVLHELVHGIFIYIFTKEKPYFGFSKGLFYTGTNYFIPKIQYIIVALAPVVILGLILHFVYINLNGYMFWVVYLIQMLNISGAVGDYYVTIVSLKLPKNIYSRDYGANMDFYGVKDE
ncbi:MAG TPA: DUF3267 domain-containing protein [Anaerovoracaceae bacterium]|nr:DUF3267 domain-containing protein [Anaerovoracaceae bacterium]